MITEASVTPRIVSWTLLYFMQLLSYGKSSASSEQYAECLLYFLYTYDFYAVCF